MIAGGSTSEYKQSAKPLSQIARELGVGYLVVAKIRWARSATGASRVQVSPELVQVPPDGAPITPWQEPFDASLTDVFQVQADIAGRVVQALGVVLADSTRQQLAERPTEDLAAYDLYLKAEAASLGAAERLDPRSPSVAGNLGRLLTRLRRYEAADSVLVRGLALSPGNRSVVLARMLVWVGKGDLDGARRVIREAEAEIPPKELAIYLATYNELYWTLTPDRQALVLEGRPVDFDGDVGSWGFALAQIYAARGDRDRSRAYADSARAGFAAQVAEAPNEGQVLALYALSLAYLGRTAEAIREGERGAAMVPVDRSTGFGTYVQQLLARIYLMAGEHDKAMDRIEALLAQPGFLSVGWLRIDPAFDPLRDHPRFRRLVDDTP